MKHTSPTLKKIGVIALLVASFSLWIAAGWCIIQTVNGVRHADKIKHLSEAQLESVLRYYESRIQTDGQSLDAETLRALAEDAYERDQALVKNANVAGYTLSSAGQDALDQRWDEVRHACLMPPSNQSDWIHRQYGEAMSNKLFQQVLEQEALAADYLRSKTTEIQTSITDEQIQSYADLHPEVLTVYQVQYYILENDEEGLDTANQIAEQYALGIPTAEHFETVCRNIAKNAPEETMFTILTVKDSGISGGICQWIMESAPEEGQLNMFTIGSEICIIRMGTTEAQTAEQQKDAIKGQLGSAAIQDWLDQLQVIVR